MNTLILLWKNKKYGWWKKTIGILILILILLLLSYYMWKRTVERLDTTATPSSSLPTPLIWYKFDAGDLTTTTTLTPTPSTTTYTIKNYGSLGSSVNATAVGSSTISQMCFRTGTGSFYFSGTNYITIPGTAIVFPPGTTTTPVPNTTYAPTTTGFTITCWFNYSYNGDGSRLFDFGNGAPSDNLLYSPRSGLSVYQGTTQRSLGGDFNLDNQTWTHFAMTMTYAANGSATSNLIIYINGKSTLSSKTAYYPVSTATRNLCYLGKSNWSADPLAKGYMDDFRYYNSVLSATDISTIYNDVNKNVSAVYNSTTNLFALQPTTFDTSYTISSYPTSSFPTYVSKSKMTVWLDASVSGSWTINTTTSTGTTTAPPTSNYMWKNLAPNAIYNAVPFTSTTYKNTWTSSSLVSSAINGMSAIYLDNTTALVLAEPSGTYTTGATLFVVFRPTTNTNLTYRTLVNRTVPTNQAAPWSMHDNYRYVGSATSQNYISSATNLTSSAFNGTNNIFTFRINNPDAIFPNTASEWLNGDNTYLNTAVNPCVDTSTYTYIGTRGDSVTSFIGYMGEIILFNTNLADMEVSRINEYLAKKWSSVWLSPQYMSGIYSMRLVNTNYYGPVVCLRKVKYSKTMKSDGTFITVSTDEFQNFYTDTTQSYLTTGPNNTGDTFATWSAQNTTVYVCVWYDQSGNNLHATNDTNGTTQPTIATQYCKYVLQFDTSLSTVLNLLGGQQPNTLCCHFYNTNTLCGTIVTTNLSDYGLRLGCSGGTTVLGSSNVGDWYYSGGGTKICYNNGVMTTNVLVGGWNVLSMYKQTPNWQYNTASFNRIGQDGYSPSTRSITGYMSEMLMYNTDVDFTGIDMYSYYARRLF